MVRIGGLSEGSHEFEKSLKLLDVRCKSSEQFPSWSAVVSIFPESTSLQDRNNGEALSSMKEQDEGGTLSTLSVHFRVGLGVNNKKFGVY